MGIVVGGLIVAVAVMAGGTVSWWTIAFFAACVIGWAIDDAMSHRRKSRE